MAHYSVAATKDNLSRLIDKALAGEQVVITRRGTPTVELRVVAPPETLSKPTKTEIYDRIRKLRASLPMSEESAVDLIRRLRDEGV